MILYNMDWLVFFMQRVDLSLMHERMQLYVVVSDRTQAMSCESQFITLCAENDPISLSPSLSSQSPSLFLSKKGANLAVRCLWKRRLDSDFYKTRLAVRQGNKNQIKISYFVGKPPTSQTKVVVGLKKKYVLK